jgi:hypothetical protein
MSQHKLDFRLAPVRCSCNKSVDIVSVEVRRQHAHSAQVQPSVGDGFEQDRELPGGSGRLNALAGRVLRQMQSTDAVREHRLVRQLRVELASVDLGELREPIGDPLAILRGVGIGFAKQHVLRDMRQRILVHG